MRQPDPDNLDVLEQLDELWCRELPLSLRERMILGPRYEMGVGPVEIAIRRLAKLRSDDEFARWLEEDASDIHRAMAMQAYLTLREKLTEPDDSRFPAAVQTVMSRPSPLRTLIQTTLETLIGQ